MSDSSIYKFGNNSLPSEIWGAKVATSIKHRVDSLGPSKCKQDTDHDGGNQLDNKSNNGQRELSHA